MKVKDIVESVGTLSHKSTTHDDPYKSSLENKKEREDLANYKRQILANFDKKINDDIFHGKLRIYIPISSDYKAPVIGGVHAVEAYRNELPENMIMKFQGKRINRLEMFYVFRDIQYALKTNGYTMENYIENKAVKTVETQRGTKEQKTSISKVLAKVGDPKLIDFFNNDPVRTGSAAKDVQIVISRHPHDIAGMSTHRSWDSCMNLRKGLYRDKVANDVKHGTLVAYLIDKKDRKVEEPKARVSIKPFVNVKDPTDIALGVEEKTYGQSNPAFVNAVTEWADKVNEIRVKGKGKFALSPELYRDSSDVRYFNVNHKYEPGSIASKLLHQEIRPYQVADEEMTPDVINLLIDMGDYFYCRIPASLAKQYQDEYVKVFVDQLTPNRLNISILSLVASANSDIEHSVIKQVFNTPLSKEEHQTVLNTIEQDPNSVNIFPSQILTPQMILLGMGSVYFRSSLIKPEMFFEDPDSYLKILEIANEKYPYLVSHVRDMPKEVWATHANQARKVFLECLYNENHINYYFELLGSVTPAEVRHQIVEYIFQYTPSDDLVEFWRKYYVNYVTSADFDFIPEKYMLQFLPEMSKVFPGYLLGKLPDSLFNTDRQLYDQLVKSAVDVDGPAAVYYLKNEKILDHYRLIHDETQRKLAALRAQPQTQQQPEVAQTQEVPKPQVESIDRIKELAGYKNAILK